MLLLRLVFIGKILIVPFRFRLLMVLDLEVRPDTVSASPSRVFVADGGKSYFDALPFESWVA